MQVYEDEPRGPDHMCGPFELRSPVVLCGPKVPSLFFIISIKMSQPSLKKKKKQACFFSLYFLPLYQRRSEFSEAGLC